MTNPRKTFVETPLGKDVLLLRGLVGHEALSEPFLLTLSLLSTKPEIEPAKLLGKTLTVTMDMPGKTPGAPGKPRYFHGYVTELASLGNHGRYHSYSVQVRPWLWLLSQSSNCRIFQKMTVPEIVKAVCSKHGFTDLEQTLSGVYERHDYRVQYRETDLDFVSRLLEQAGIYYFFRHDKTKHTLVLADGPTAHKPVAGFESIDFALDVGSGPGLSDRIETWRTAQHVKPGACALDDYDFEKPQTELKVRLNAPKSHEKNRYELFDYPGGYRTTAVGERYARVRLEAQHAQFELARGRGFVHGLAVGSTFRLARFPVAKENTEHLVVSADFRFALDNYEASAGPESHDFECDFTALKTTTPFRPTIRTPRPIIAGLQTAKVVGPKADEICTDKYGRVKVQFPWDREGKSDENSSCFIRVAQLWAGSGWGSQYVPRIGHEVVVSFLEGDPDQPLIIGSVYNAKNAAPFELPGKAQVSGVKTDSTKKATGHNELSFDDTAGAELVVLHGQRDVQSTAGGTLSLQAKNVSATASASLTLECGKSKIVMHADGMIVIEGTFVTVAGTNLTLNSTGPGLMKGVKVIPI